MQVELDETKNKELDETRNYLFVINDACNSPLIICVQLQ